MSLREWLIIIGALVILGVVLDGLRRMYRARQDSLEIARGMGSGDIGQTPIDDGYNSELPNGGARVVGGDDRAAAEAGAAHKEDAGDRPPPFTPEDDKSEPAAGPADESVHDKATEPLNAADDEIAEPISASEDDGIVGPARVRSSGPENETGAGNVASGRQETSGMSAGHLWQKLREGAARVGEAAGHTPDDPEAAGPAPSDHGSSESSGERPLAGANRPEAEEVLVVNVHCRGEDRYQGSAIRSVLEACGMEFGDLAIYHRHEQPDTRTPVQFSVASAVTPGTLRPGEMEALRTPGLSFFMSLPGPSDSVQAFDYMLETAQTVARNLGGELRDENHSVMTTQTIEHCRQRIREFERKRRSVKA